MQRPIHVVGVRELKAQLSRCLKRVQAGERLTVTDRGRAIATLVPVEAGPAVEWAHQMIAAGQARWGGGKPAGLARRVASRGKPASRMVIEDRR
jgi:prevent-host-death family protein